MGQLQKKKKSSALRVCAETQQQNTMIVKSTHEDIYMAPKLLLNPVTNPFQRFTIFPSLPCLSCASFRRWRRSWIIRVSMPSFTFLCSQPLTASSWIWRGSIALMTSEEWLTSWKNGKASCWPFVDLWYWHGRHDLNDVFIFHQYCCLVNLWRLFAFFPPSCWQDLAQMYLAVFLCRRSLCV